MPTIRRGILYVMEVVHQLREALRGDVVVDSAVLDAYSTDASLFTVRPQIVVRPKDAEDVKKLVRIVAAARADNQTVSITARAAGTDMSGGPLNESIIVSFTEYFTHIGPVQHQRVTVEPGVFYRDLEAALAKHNLLLPSYPASKDLCAVGGMVANNAGGEKTLTYGKTADYVTSLKVVLRDGNEYTFRALTEHELHMKKQEQTVEGEIYRDMHALLTDHADITASARPQVSKNSSGYALWDVINKRDKTFDLTKVLIGSQGTLGLITNIEFRLIHPRPHSRLLIIFLPDFSLLGSIIKHVLPFQPESFESYDDQTFKVAVRLLPALAKRWRGGLLSLIRSFIPDVGLVLRGGIPKLVLLAEFTGDTAAEALNRAMAAQRRLQPFKLTTKVTRTEADAQKYWLIRRESFSLLRRSVHGKHTAPFIDDFVVPPTKLTEFLPRLYEILDKHHILYTVAGHIGDGNFHIIPLMDLADPKTKEILTQLSQQVYPLVLQYGGSLSGEHNDGLVRSSYLAQQFGPDVYRLFEQTKHIFDPDNIFNPGKKVGTSWEYALAHLAKNQD